MVGCGSVVGIEVGRRLGAREPEYELDPGPDVIAELSGIMTGWQTKPEEA